MLKKLIFLLIFAVGIAAISDTYPVSAATSSYTNDERGVRFRVNQRLKSVDGREIYLYTSGKVELYDNDRMIDECEYVINGNEIKLIKYGRVLYKASFHYKSDRKTLQALQLAGTTYYSQR